MTVLHKAKLCTAIFITSTKVIHSTVNNQENGSLAHGRFKMMVHWHTRPKLCSSCSQKKHSTGVSTPHTPQTWSRVPFSSFPELETPWKVNSLKMSKQWNLKQLLEMPQTEMVSWVWLVSHSVVAGTLCSDVVCYILCIVYKVITRSQLTGVRQNMSVIK
jgi:hypothetical protein